MSSSHSWEQGFFSVPSSEGPNSWGAEELCTKLLKCKLELPLQKCFHKCWILTVSEEFLWAGVLLKLTPQPPSHPARLGCPHAVLLCVQDFLGAVSQADPCEVGICCPGFAGSAWPVEHTESQWSWQQLYLSFLHLHVLCTSWIQSAAQKMGLSGNLWSCPWRSQETSNGHIAGCHGGKENMSPCLQVKAVPLTAGRTLLPANLLEMLCPAHPE